MRDVSDDPQSKSAASFGQPVLTVPKPGDTLDHYRMDSLVVRTALTEIFCGTDLGTGRKVAIKIPRLDAADDPSVHEHFLHEEKIGSKLHHPGVMRVLCDPERSRLYLVTEWVEGRPLRAILNEQGRLAPDRAVPIVRSVCDALYYVHSRGVVHRDLKPENILIGSENRITLIDFGIAVAKGAQRMALAKPSEAAGTPDYISPEEVRGIRGDARSDIYSLGVVLFEMLAGRTPFEGCNPLAIMNSRLIDDPPSLRELAPEVPVRLEEIVRRALHRDPRRRYASAFELARALASLGLDAPGSAG